MNNYSELTPLKSEDFETNPLILDDSEEGSEIYFPQVEKSKDYRIFYVIFLLIVAVCGAVHLVLSFSDSSTLSAEFLVTSKKQFNILFWIPFFGHSHWYSDKDGTVKPTHLANIACPVTNCFFTHDRKYLKDFKKFDAVIFHAPENISNIVPKERSADQLFVFATLEAPTLIYDDLNLFKNFYNITMTYRMDSDVFWSYGKVFDIETDEIVAPGPNPQWKSPDEHFYDEKLMEIIKHKTRSVAWFASNCNSFNQRLELVEKLKTLIDVDVYGRCGNLTCSKDECNHKLTTTYKFYLSFENSLCVDYISEKLFRPMQELSIPVIFNGAGRNNSLSAPPHSYIDVDDYDTVEDLARYLKYLIDSPKEYIKYFWWKQHYRVQSNGNFAYAFCNLCKKLNDAEFMAESHIIEDIKAWNNDGKCNQTSRIKI